MWSFFLSGGPGLIDLSLQLFVRFLKSFVRHGGVNMYTCLKEQILQSRFLKFYSKRGPFTCHKEGLFLLCFLCLSGRNLTIKITYKITSFIGYRHFSFQVCACTNSKYLGELKWQTRCCHNVFWRHRCLRIWIKLLKQVIIFISSLPFSF